MSDYTASSNGSISNRQGIQRQPADYPTDGRNAYAERKKMGSVGGIVNRLKPNLLTERFILILVKMT